jgi:hypothetical protein
MQRVHYWTSQTALLLPRVRPLDVSSSDLHRERGHSLEKCDASDTTHWDGFDAARLCEHNMV